MSLAGAALVAVAAFTAGGVNAVAGGGSLVSFPALLAVGLEPVAANVTNTITIWPGYAGGASTVWRDVTMSRRAVARLAVTAACGAVLGVVLLLVSDPDVFDALVPWLVLG